MQDSWEGCGGMASSSKEINGGERVRRVVQKLGRKEEEALLLNLPSKSCHWGVFPRGRLYRWLAGRTAWARFKRATVETKKKQVVGAETRTTGTTGQS